MSDHQKYVAEYARLQQERDKYRDKAHLLNQERDRAVNELEKLKRYNELRDSLFASAIEAIRGIYPMLPRYSCKSMEPDGCPVCVARGFLTEEALSEEVSYAS